MEKYPVWNASFHQFIPYLLCICTLIIMIVTDNNKSHVLSTYHVLWTALNDSNTTSYFVQQFSRGEYFYTNTEDCWLSFYIFSRIFPGHMVIYISQPLLKLNVVMLLSSHKREHRYICNFSGIFYKRFIPDSLSFPLQCQKMVRNWSVLGIIC